ncbi:hypothetical protein GYA54_02490 [Candidatus Kuenenbacteria bacterium]|nr:hypothetical protein [Candidatus Kuenenbacteria bacterium]
MFKKHLPKKYTPIIMVALALLALLVVAIVAGLDSKLDFIWDNNQPTTSTPVAIDTSDWKIYRNEEYGFEFKYPEDLTKKENNPNDKALLYIEFNKYNKKYFLFGVYKTEEQLSAKQWLDNKWAGYSGKWPGTYQETKINNYDVTLATLDNRKNEDPFRCYMRYALFYKNNILYSFYLEELCNQNDNKDIEVENNNSINLFDKIVSTIRFK